MLLSRAAQVALAVLPLLDPSGPSGRGHGVRELAEKSGLPAPFVAKVLQRLADRGLLRSKRGRAGGFLLGRPAAEMTVADVVLALAGKDDLQAAFPAPAGPAGRLLAPAREMTLHLLDRTSLRDLARLP